MMPNEYPTRLDICDGKYTLIIDMDTGRAECLRNGEKWRDLVGDKMVLALFDELVEARYRAEAAKAEVGKREISEAHNAVTRRLSVLAGENTALRAELLTEKEWVEEYRRQAINFSGEIKSLQAKLAEMEQQRAQPTQSVPVGWKLVPIEPTLEMQRALIDGVNQYDSWTEGYRDMLAAAPETKPNVPN